MTPTHIGISNVKQYPVFKVADYDTNIGLTELDCCTFMVWCTFEKIVAKPDPK